VDLIAIVEAVAAVQRRIAGHLDVARQRPGQILGKPVGDVDPEAVYAAVGPELERGEEILPDLRVVPIQVRLLGCIQVQVPLPIGHSRPCRSPEEGLPIRRRL